MQNTIFLRIYMRKFAGVYTDTRKHKSRKQPRCWCCCSLCMFSVCPKTQGGTMFDDAWCSLRSRSVKLFGGLLLLLAGGCSRLRLKWVRICIDSWTDWGILVVTSKPAEHRLCIRNTLNMLGGGGAVVIVCSKQQQHREHASESEYRRHNILL